MIQKSGPRENVRPASRFARQLKVFCIIGTFRTVRLRRAPRSRAIRKAPRSRGVGKVPCRFRETARLRGAFWIDQLVAKSDRSAHVHKKLLHKKSSVKSELREARQLEKSFVRLRTVFSNYPASRSYVTPDGSNSLASRSFSKRSLHHQHFSETPNFTKFSGPSDFTQWKTHVQLFHEIQPFHKWVIWSDFAILTNFFKQWIIRSGFAIYIYIYIYIYVC